MTERLGGQEFAEQLPKAAEFQKGVRHAGIAIELAEDTYKRLQEQVDSANQELKEQALVGQDIELTAAADFRHTDEGFTYSFYGMSGSKHPLLTGWFEGLTIIDTAGASIENRTGIRLQLQPLERYVVCAEVNVRHQAPKNPRTSVFVPLKSIETPLEPREFYDSLVD